MFFRYSALATILLVIAIGLTAVCCGGKADAAGTEQAAAKAMEEENFGEAFDLYQSLLDWKGEGEVNEATRFKASLESIKCQAYQEKFDEAVAGTIDLEKKFNDQMSDPKAYKHALAVISVMDKKKSPVSTTVKLLEYATNKWPAQKTNFDEFGKRLKDRASTPAEMEELKKLGYL